MTFLDTIFGGGNLVKEVGDAVDKVFTSDEERLEKRNELYKAEREYNFNEMKLLSGLDQGQMEVNKVEAASTSLFVAGWRPAIGWIGVLSLGYQFIIYPLLTWIPGIHVPPPIQSDLLWTIITGMLGIGTMRSFEKWQGVDTKKMG